MESHRLKSIGELTMDVDSIIVSRAKDCGQNNQSYITTLFQPPAQVGQSNLGGRIKVENGFAHMTLCHIFQQLTVKRSS